MKKQFNLWLNIVAICLSVCVIVVGVYAVQSATLSITGSIGFEAHKDIYKKDTNGNPIVVYKYDDTDKTIWNKTVGNYISGLYTEDSPCYATYFPYYITMGSKDDIGINWLIVGTNNNGTITPLTSEDETILEKGKLLADTIYVALSAECLERRIFNESTSDHDGDIYPSDYALSDIRAYLRSIETSGFAGTYSLTSSSITISSRKLSELYADIDKIYPTSGKSTIDDSNKESDDFWLLSQAEVFTLFNTTKTGNFSASITTLLGETSNTVSWWYRSPSPVSKFDVLCVGLDGGLRDGHGVDTTVGFGLRPAFQF